MSPAVEHALNRFNFQVDPTCSLWEATLIKAALGAAKHQTEGDHNMKAKTKTKTTKSKYYEAQKRKADRLMAAFFRNLP